MKLQGPAQRTKSITTESSGHVRPQSKHNSNYNEDRGRQRSSSLAPPQSGVMVASSVTTEPKSVDGALNAFENIPESHLTEKKEPILSEYQLENSVLRYAMTTGSSGIGTRSIPILLKRLIRGIPDIDFFLDAIAATVLSSIKTKIETLNMVYVKHPWREDDGASLTTTIRRSDPESLHIFLKDLQKAPFWMTSPDPRFTILVEGEWSKISGKKRVYAEFMDLEESGSR